MQRKWQRSLSLVEGDRAANEAALPYAGCSRDPFRGKVYQITGEAYARVAGSNLEADGSFAYFTCTRSKFGTRATMARVARMQATPPLITEI